MEMMINPPIITDRLTIRALEDSDLPLMVDIASEDPTLVKFINGEYSERLSESYWKEITKPNVINGMIFLSETHEFCGRICLTFEEQEAPELGITLMNKAQNRGIGPESIIAFTNWIYQTVGANRLKVRIEPKNTHSKHLFEKIGAVFVEQRCFFSERTMQVLRELDLDTSSFEDAAVLVYNLDLPIRC